MSEDVEMRELADANAEIARLETAYAQERHFTHALTHYTDKQYAAIHEMVEWLDGATCSEWEELKSCGREDLDYPCAGELDECRDCAIAHFTPRPQAE